MSAAFSTRTEQNPGGQTARQWHDHNIVDFDGIGIGKVHCHMADGTIQPQSISQCALLFSDARYISTEKKSNVRGHAPEVEGTPQYYVLIREALEHSDKLSHHKGIASMVNPMYVPIYHFGGGKSKTVALECGSIWVSASVINKTKYHMHHVANMYLYAIQSVFIASAKEKDISKLPMLVDMKLRLYQAAKSYFNAVPDAFKIVTPLRDADDCMNMMNRTIAFSFFDTKWTKEEFLRIMETSYKRWRNRIKVDKDVCIAKHPIYGIIAIVTSISNLRKTPINNGDEKGIAQIAKDINDSFTSLMTVIAENTPKDLKQFDDLKFNNTFNKTIVYTLFQMSDFPEISKELSDKFYDFCVEPSNLYVFAPLEEWGVIPKVVIPFKSQLADFNIKGKVNYSITKLRAVETEGGVDNFKISSTAPSEWSGFGILTPGEYSFVGETVGASSTADGSSLGQINIANMRITFGNDILSDTTEGRASSGMWRRKVNDKWKWDDTKQTLDVAKGFKLNVDENGSFDVMYNNGLWFQISRHAFNSPVLIAYKYLTFNMSFVPLPKKELFIKEESKEEKKVVKEPEQSVDLIKGLTGAALMDKLAELLNKKL
jgi:hypothetical protein